MKNIIKKEKSFVFADALFSTLCNKSLTIHRYRFAPVRHAIGVLILTQRCKMPAYYFMVIFNGYWLLFQKSAKRFSEKPTARNFSDSSTGRLSNVG